MREREARESEDGDLKEEFSFDMLKEELTAEGHSGHSPGGPEDNRRDLTNRFFHLAVASAVIRLKNRGNKKRTTEPLFALLLGID
jgi:hypothetical protein